MINQYAYDIRNLIGRPCAYMGIGADGTAEHSHGPLSILAFDTMVYQTPMRAFVHACENHLACYLWLGWYPYPPPQIPTKVIEPTPEDLTQGPEDLSYGSDREL